MKFGMNAPPNYVQKVEQAAREYVQKAQQAAQQMEEEEEKRRIALAKAALEEEARRRQREKLLWTIASPLFTIGGGGLGMLLTAANNPLYNGGYLVIWGVLGAILGFIVILGIIKVYGAHNNQRVTSLSSGRLMSPKQGISRRVAIEGLVAIACIAAISSVIAWLHALTDADIIVWNGDQDVGQSSQTTPALAVFNVNDTLTLYLAFVANNSYNHLLLISSTDGVHWTDNQDVGQSSQAFPALAVFNETLNLAFMANNSSNEILLVSSRNS